jgi:hypothetical protein
MLAFKWLALDLAQPIGFNMAGQDRAQTELLKFSRDDDDDDKEEEDWWLLDQAQLRRN